MFRYSAALILAAFAIAGMLHFLKPTQPDPDAFAAATRAEWEQKEKFLREDPASPFRGQPGEFKAPSYFPPNMSYVVKARLVPIEEKKVRVVITSTGEQTQYLEYAWAMFSLHDRVNQLLILEIMDMGPTRGKLFLAFADETSARETYGGGRYLDVKKVPAATSIELDFNKAYNPYCAYNDSYSCPLPPRENILPIAIQAGEKSYK